MATYTSDGSPSDIQAKVNGASAGDTVSVPSGSYTWTAGVKISKSITLSGAGSGSTTIKRGAGFNGCLVHVTNLASDVPVRVSGFKFDNVTIKPGVNTYNVLVEHTHTHDHAYTKIRIDNCIFLKGQRPVCWCGGAWGVVDHCTFTDCDNCAYFIGWEDDHGNAAWNRQDWHAGGPNFPFFEDCNFNCTNAFGQPNSPWMFYHEHGGRSIVRYSTIDSHTNTNSIEGPIDCHANQNYWVGKYNDTRATVRTEFYNNNVHLNNSFRVMDLRGGSHLIHHNTYTFDNSSPKICDFREEEVDETSVPFGGGVRTANFYPCEDQINATFVWGNKINGVDQTDADIGVGNFGDPGGNDKIVIQKGRDFWTKAPDSTTHTSYTQPASPSSPSYPTNYLEVTSYTPYTYPHPLVSDGAAPAPTVTAINPTSGTISGGTSVTVTGTGFTGATAVKFGTANATSYRVNSDTSITATSPSRAAGMVHITVTNSNGTSASSAAAQFTFIEDTLQPPDSGHSTGRPTITSISPTSGSTSGGTSVTINGSGFTGCSGVNFGPTPATSYSFVSDSQVKAVAPAGSAGTVDIRVFVESALTTSDQFSFTSEAGFVQKLQIATVSSSSLRSVTATYANAVASGDVLCAIISWFGSASTTVTVSDTVNGSWTQGSQGVIANGTNQHSVVFYKLNCASSAAGLVVTTSFTTAVPYIAIYGGQWHGYTGVDLAVSAKGTYPTTPTVNITTTAANDVLVGFADWASGTKWSGAGTGFTVRAFGKESTLPAGHLASDDNVTTAQRYTFAPSVSTGTNGNPWILQVIAFKQSVPGTGAFSLFSANDTPGTTDWNDTNPVEQGVKFQSSVAGTVTAIRFYKGPLNTGTHVGNLWSASGTLLATATFSNETSSGWQQVNFSSPVPITANTIYVASYHNGGEYTADQNYFNTAKTNGPLTAPATGNVAGGNGVYVYGSTSAFPTNTNLASNFWVDVVFQPSSSAP